MNKVRKMKTKITLTCLILSSLPLIAQSADYALSVDGSTVVRLAPQGTATAGSFSPNLLPSGWVSGAVSGGTTSVGVYRAGFEEGSGGAEITATFNKGSPVAEGRKLEWVQVITTNSPFGGVSSPYLDNAANRSAPFYSLTNENLLKTLPADTINFYDRPLRPTSALATTNPVTWNASLFPVVTDSAKAITVYDGVTWGWTMSKATVGTTTGSFTNPGPASATVTGVGSSRFSWGTGDPSSLTFSSTAFDTLPNTAFKLGTLTYRNGTIGTNTGASKVQFNAGLHFANIPEKDFDISSTFNLINTPNTSDPIASADIVSIGDWGYTFNVLEGATATVDIMAMLSTGITGTASGIERGAALFNQNAFDPSPNFSLNIVGLFNPTTNGFVTTTVPLPSTLALLICGYGLFGFARTSFRNPN
jgi:hypothetical protein